MRTALLLAVLLAGCADGTALLVGTPRPAIQAEQVKILTDMPPNAVVIAMVTAESRAGLNAQGDQDFALAEIKKQAAAQGANAVVLDSISDTSRLSGTFRSLREGRGTKLSGKAVFVQ